MSNKVAGIPRWLGHVALRVRDVDKTAAFYRDVVGLTLRKQMYGITFLGIREDASHELALMPLPAGAADSDPSRVGLYHFAWEMESFDDLEKLHERLLAQNVRIGGYSPDPNSANVMFFDPEGNEMEAIWEPTAEEIDRVKQSGQPMPRLTRAPGF
jgi:catechol-2,3-dioxygenase